MKKFSNSIRGIVCLCLGILLFWNTGSYASAAKMPDAQAENTVVDTRPDYVIYVNRALNCITVKQLDESGTQTPVKSIVCSCGREGRETPEGTFQTSDYYEWRKMVDGTGQKYFSVYKEKY